MSLCDPASATNALLYFSSTKCPESKLVPPSHPKYCLPNFQVLCWEYGYSDSDFVLFVQRFSYFLLNRIAAVELLKDHQS